VRSLCYCRVTSSRDFGGISENGGGAFFHILVQRHGINSHNILDNCRLSLLSSENVASLPTCKPTLPCTYVLDCKTVKGALTNLMTMMRMSSPSHQRCAHLHRRQTHCVRGAGKSITHMQQRRHHMAACAVFSSPVSG